MSRYIDADKLMLDIRLDKRPTFRGAKIPPSVKETMFAYLDSAPHIDLVRCKECRHWIGETEHYEDREYKACWQLCGQYMNSEFWCKYGEREGE
ncbi:MAG: hypothetical protein IIY21_03835 [Clostridiales bacterium]|nr:hypothetical protein [Clostridiales bacterium]